MIARVSARCYLPSPTLIFGVHFTSGIFPVSQIHSRWCLCHCWYLAVPRPVAHSPCFISFLTGQPQLSRDGPRNTRVICLPLFRSEPYLPTRLRFSLFLPDTWTGLDVWVSAYWPPQRTLICQNCQTIELQAKYGLPAQSSCHTCYEFGQGASV